MATRARQLLAQRIRYFRFLRRWSQGYLASLAKLDRTYISGVERGRCNPTVDSIERIAAAFDLSVPELWSVEPARLHPLDRHFDRREKS